MAAIEQELLERFQRLDPEQKQRVLSFVRELTYLKSESISDFFERTKDIQISKEDLATMKHIAEEDEERIEWDDWNSSSTLFD